MKALVVVKAIYFPYLVDGGATGCSRFASHHQYVCPFTTHIPGELLALCVVALGLFSVHYIQSMWFTIRFFMLPVCLSI